MSGHNGQNLRDTSNTQSLAHLNSKGVGPKPKANQKAHVLATQRQVKVGLWNRSNACKPPVRCAQLGPLGRSRLGESCSPCQTSCCLPASFIAELDLSMDTEPSRAPGAGGLNNRKCLMTWAAQLPAEGLAKASNTLCHGAETLPACQRPAEKKKRTSWTHHFRMHGSSATPARTAAAGTPTGKRPQTLRKTASWAPCSYLASTFNLPSN